ncbi:DegT/DnrJ/EryC1/StrS aminotransferase family protein [uncultured Algimonas sp.]|uniref:DegT/DnrJ/EryC1/StrS family aminotransferase n=1 Tax=uncultured Algimonas sp. TaxID=1547920 RepID=UPI0026043FDD|nr:DegT/DnrJ/EryC1/StrS aminotransferase family protein [uncultured Algimonas sp.]
MQFIDLHAQQARLKDDIDAGIADVLRHGRYILGPQVGELEKRLAEFACADHALSCANGTDALLLPLMAWGVGLGDAVFCPSFTYHATAEVIALLGATPIFVDIDRDTYNLCPDSLKQAIANVRAKGELTPRAVIVVDLFGQCADYKAITPIVRESGMKLVSDSAQGFGSTLDERHPVAWADVQTTSFFPAKPLGCYGDGGALVTNDAALLEVLQSLRFHGRGEEPFDNNRIGLNSRLDTIQAAILLPKLAVFAEEIVARNRIAARYDEGLRNHVSRIPVIPGGVISTWAQYTVEVCDPAAFSKALSEVGIPTARYYPRPTHRQTAYADFPTVGNGLPVTDLVSRVCISLPMHAYLKPEDQDKVIEAALAAMP